MANAAAPLELYTNTTPKRIDFSKYDGWASGVLMGSWVNIHGRLLGLENLDDLAFLINYERQHQNRAHIIARIYGRFSRLRREHEENSIYAATGRHKKKGTRTTRRK